MNAKARKLKSPQTNKTDPQTIMPQTDDVSDDNADSEDDQPSQSDSEDDEGILLSDVGSDVDEQDVDVVPYIKLHKDNHAALTQSLSTFALPFDKLPFHAHQSVTASVSVTIDINDDLQRELAFYKQAVDAAQEGRRKLLAENIPFSRPPDYFAEMVKDDEHMDKLRDRMIAEEASKKNSQAAKRHRDLKKFGKQVQVAKIQERDKEKRTTLEKIKALKRKRKDGGTLTTEDNFDVELDAAEGPKAGKRTKLTREKRNDRYGFGGSKRKEKRNDDDVGDMSSFEKRGRGGFRGRGGRGGKRGGGAQRPGKRRRMQQK